MKFPKPFWPYVAFTLVSAFATELAHAEYFCTIDLLVRKQAARAWREKLESDFLTADQSGGGGFGHFFTEPNGDILSLSWKMDDYPAHSGRTAQVTIDRFFKNPEEHGGAKSMRLFGPTSLKDAQTSYERAGDLELIVNCVVPRQGP